MLVINGADDYFVPKSDTLVFAGRPDTEVHLIPGTGHVAMSKAAQVVPVIIGWLRNQLSSHRSESKFSGRTKQRIILRRSTWRVC